jgi:hypothetical protein
MADGPGSWVRTWNCEGCVLRASINVNLRTVDFRQWSVQIRPGTFSSCAPGRNESISFALLEGLSAGGFI